MTSRRHCPLPVMGRAGAIQVVAAAVVWVVAGGREEEESS